MSDLERAEQDVRTAIYNKLCRPNESSYSFICERDLENVLNDTTKISLIVASLGLSDIEQEQLFQGREYLKTLAILINLGQGYCTAFPHFYRAFKQHRYSDKDLPLPEDLLNRLLGGIPACGKFYQEQFLFCPLKIRGNALRDEGSPPVDRLTRLPFLSRKQIGEGGYGTVFQVDIPTGYLVDRHGNTSVETKAYACKQLKYLEEGKLEFENLSKLDRSMRRIDNILYYRAVFEYEGKIMIILPLMEWGNLGAFLRRDESSFGTSDLLKATEASSDSDADMKASILQQISAVADALDFLHHSLGSIEFPNISCAHKDLKPQNILIGKEDGCMVGRWCLSDFGISAIDTNNLPNRSGDDSQSRGSFTSSRRTGSYLWTNVAPAERAGGAYQAPEVLERQEFSRTSDVWSMTCIFAEVLAFVLAGSDGVKDFEKHRRQNHPDAGFSELRTRFLSIQQSSSCLREGVGKYLKIMCKQDPAGEWVECAVKIIKRYLVKHSPRELRPDSTHLRESLSHVSQHFISVTKDRKSPKDICHILHPKKSRHRHPRTPGPGSISISMNAKDPATSQSEDDTKMPPTPARQPSIQKIERQNSLPHTPIFVRAQQTPSNSSSNSISSSNITWPYGKTISPRLLAVSLNADASLATCLTEDVVLKAGKVQQSNDGVTFPHFEQASLDHLNYSWSKLEIAGSYIAVWGRPRKHVPPTYQYYVCEHPRMTLNLLDGLSGQWLHSCMSMRVSRNGCVLFVGGDCLYAANVKRASPTTLDPTAFQHLKPLLDQHEFADAIFNDDGTYLYAWSFGPGPSVLYVWRVEAEGVVLSSSETYRYDLPHYGEPSVQLLPYNTDKGCIVWKYGNECFAADLVASRKPQQPRLTHIPELVKACIFRNGSLVTVNRQRKLCERQIHWKLQHDIADAWQPLCKLQADIKSSSSLKVVKQEGFVMIVIYHLTGALERICFPDAKSRP